MKQNEQKSSHFSYYYNLSNESIVNPNSFYSLAFGVRAAPKKA